MQPLHLGVTKYCQLFNIAHSHSTSNLRYFVAECFVLNAESAVHLLGSFSNQRPPSRKILDF